MDAVDLNAVWILADHHGVPLVADRLAGPIPRTGIGSLRRGFFLAGYHQTDLRVPASIKTGSATRRRHCEVVQCDQGVWIYSTGQRRQGCIRDIGGRKAGLSSLNQGAEVS